jgi:hypothetical protein
VRGGPPFRGARFVPHGRRSAARESAGNTPLFSGVAAGRGRQAFIPTDPNVSLKEKLSAYARAKNGLLAAPKLRM